MPATESAPSGARWWTLLSAVVILGVMARVLYVTTVLADIPPGLDAIWYVLQGGFIRDGLGYVAPASVFEGSPRPTAGFPPLYPLWQAAWQTAVGDGETSVRLAGVVPGAATMLLTGVLGAKLAGPTVGLVAAAVAAADPALLAADGSSMSENIAVPLAAASVLAALVAVRSGLRLGYMVLLGALTGLATLTRQDLVLLGAVLAGAAVALVPTQPSTSGASTVTWARRATAMAAFAAALTAVVAPWMWRNHRVLDVVAVSTASPSSALAGSNCDLTFGGESLGSWDHDCVYEPEAAGGSFEVDAAARNREQAIQYVRSEMHRLPAVLVARQLRVWALWDPADLARRDAEETRSEGFQRKARPIEAVLALVGTGGLVLLLRRRGRTGLLLLAPLVVVAVSATVTYGNPRFSSIAHPVFAIGVASLAAAGVSAREYRARLQRL